MKKTILAIALAAISGAALAQEYGNTTITSTTVVGAGVGSAAAVTLSGTGSVNAVSSAEGDVRAYGSANAYHYNYNENYYYNYYYGYADQSQVNTSGNVYLGNYYDQDGNDPSKVKTFSSIDATVNNGNATALAVSGIGGFSLSTATAPGLFSDTVVLTPAVAEQPVE